MTENLKIDQLILEEALAKGLGISKSVLYKLRSKGLPWIALGGHVYYHEETFMTWLLKHQRRVSDPRQEVSQEHRRLQKTTRSNP